MEVINNELKNPAIVKSISFFFKKWFKKEDLIYFLNKKFNLETTNTRFNNIKINKDLKLKIKRSKEIDYYNIEFWLVARSDKYNCLDKDIKKIFNSLNINLDELDNISVFSSKSYIITESNLDLKYSDKLSNSIEFKKEWNYRYIYSTWNTIEFLPEYLSHISKIEIYYSRILSLYKTFFINFPEIKKSNNELIKEYTSIIEQSNIKVTKQNIIELNKRINYLEWINFWINYDLESIENNLENIIWRLKSIWWENARYFDTKIEKINFIKNSFQRSFKKNKLIKENIASNYLTFLQSSLEREKIENENKKINHIKNIKEILWSLAFIEIFIQWLSELPKVYTIDDKLSNILTNTAFMRMNLIIGFVILYFFWQIVKFISKKIKQK